MFFSADISCSFGMDGGKVKGLWESYAKIVWIGQIMHFIILINCDPEMHFESEFEDSKLFSEVLLTELEY